MDETGSTSGERRLWLHVGAPKTGTTYLQTILWANRDTLKAAGMWLPGDAQADHHRAAMDLREKEFHNTSTETRHGCWQQLVTEVHAWPGDAVITSELLAWAGEQKARDAVAAFPDHEVHVIFAMRDFARQIPAVWQETVKNRGTQPFGNFLARALGEQRGRPAHVRMWKAQAPRRVLGAWAADLPPQRVHILTVPPEGARRELLWERFGRTIGVEPDSCDTAAGQHNPGLGALQTELLRRVNQAIPPSEVPWSTYSQAIKRGLVRTALADSPEDPLGPSGKITVPPERFPQVRKRCTAAVRFLRAQRYDIVGDLSELEPVAPPIAQQPLMLDDRQSAILDMAAQAVAEVVRTLQQETGQQTKESGADGE